jgi:hypothetical protein
MDVLGFMTLLGRGIYFVRRIRLLRVRASSNPPTSREISRQCRAGPTENFRARDAHPNDTLCDTRRVLRGAA